MFKPKNRGFTLVEVMLCMTVLVGVLAGLLSLYIYSFDLQETSANISKALFQVRAKLEEIRGSTFANIITNYNNKTFNLTDLNGIMLTQATYAAGTSDLIDIRIIACWSQKGGRIIGEDKDLDGQLDIGEDADGDGILDSPVELITSIAYKE